MRLRALCNLGTKTFEIGNRVGINCTSASRYSAKVGPVGTLEGTDDETAKGHRSLLKEFPEPKDLLYRTLARSVGVSDASHLIQYNCTDGEVKRATVTVMWPEKIESVGFGSRKVLAERHAAAAACQKLRELGVLKEDVLPRKKKGRGRPSPASMWRDEDEEYTVPPFKSEFLSRPQSRTKRMPEDDPRVEEAWSTFSQPKALLMQVVQKAVSPNKVRDTVRYRTGGGRFKVCELTLHWPEKMTFEAFGRSKLEAERKASALACLRLKELELLDENNMPLTHAQYHRDQVREAGERMRRPCSLVIPEEQVDKIRQYLTKYPIEAEMQKLWDEEDQHAASRQAYEEDEEAGEEEAEEQAVTDAITGRAYRPLAPDQEKRLSAKLLEQWESANPRMGVSLPVDAHRERVVSTVDGARVIVLAGETGCGKTTRVPRFLLEGRVMAGEGATCNILVTQPRRISAVSVAQRVAQEMGPALKPSVGYQVRLESRPPEQSGGALLFLTVGVLLRKLQSNPTLRGVSHVVVDEVHERDVNTDLLLALLRALLPHNPQLRLVLMSATGDTQRLAQYFGGCPVVRVPGFMHPVQERYLEDVLGEIGRRPHQQAAQKRRARKGDDDDDATPDVDLVADVIKHIHKTGDPGAILCFLPGWQDIKTVQQILEESPAFRSQLVLPLHSSMSVADQQAVFQRPPEGQRKIVLATNIAETSITIDDIVHVVDAGSQKEQSYDPRTKVSCLDTVWVSRSNVTQRKGRAGRCQPGNSYHLFPRERLDSMTAFPIPEILRTPLESLILQAKVHSPQSKAVEFLSQVLDSPDRAAIEDAVRILQDIGVLDKSESLTPLGERVACMSCDPRLGKVLVLSALFRCTSPLISVAACLTRDPFFNSMENRALINKAKEELAGSSCSDFLVFSRAVQGWREQQDREDRNEYMNAYTLSGARLRFIQGLARQFSENLFEAELVSNPNDCLRNSSTYNQFSHEDELLKAVLMAGLYPNLIQVKRGVVNKGRFRPDGISFRTQTGPVVLHRSTINRGKMQLPSRWLTFFSAVQQEGMVFIRDSSSVHPLALLLMTDCDLTEKVSGDHVVVALPGKSLVRWELSTETWNLLWELRTSLQAMFHRNMRPDAANDSPQDTELIGLLVHLLTHTDQAGEDGLSDTE
ncbi:ATP-dependent RNA helicase DHX30 [Sardina pilchardus]|uniref:ATP-dependent RNA helicase DHX30 n=1 Tax=Sardina pilchardus TaxID=27697 RepID=UPI002E137CF6